MKIIGSINRAKWHIRMKYPLVNDGKSYYVKVPEQKELGMPWDTRNQARQYRKFLKENSRMNLRPEIWEIIFADGFQVEERKIS